MAILSPTGIRANSDIVTAVSSTLPETTCTVGADGSQVCEEISAKTSGSGDESDDETMTAPVPSMGDSALPDDCRDQEDECTYWSALGECETNPAYMLTMCARSCKSCENTKISEVTKLYGEQQYYEDEATTARIEDMHKYMTETVFVNASYAKVQSEVSQ